MSENGERLRGYPEEISKKPGVTVVSARHADKETSTTILESADVQLQLSEAGKENARQEALEFYHYILRVVPFGGIVSLSSSILDRSVETRQIFIDTLLECIRNNEDHASAVFAVYRYNSDGTPRSQDEIRRATRDTRARYVIIDEKADEDLGYRRSEGDNVGPFNGAMEFFKNEHFVSMMWAAHPDEFPELIERLYEEVRAPYGDLSEEEEAQLLNRIVEEAEKYLFHSRRTPEELAANQLEGIERSVATALEVHPKRRHVLHFIQHAPGLSFLALALFQKDGISFKNYDSLGDYQHYLEAMSFDVDTNGNVIFVDFRKNRSSIEPVKLSDVIADLYQKATLREKAWEDFFAQRQFAQAA